MNDEQSKALDTLDTLTHLVCENEWVAVKLHAEELMNLAMKNLQPKRPCDIVDSLLGSL